MKKKIDNIVNAIAGGMFHPSMKDKMDELENQKKNILTRITKAEYELEAYNFTSDQVEEYILKFRDIKEFLPEGQKKVVGMLVNKIIVYEDKKDIEIINPFDKRAKTPENEQKNTIATPEVNSNSLDLSGEGEPHQGKAKHTNNDKDYFLLLSIDITKYRHNSK